MKTGTKYLLYLLWTIGAYFVILGVNHFQHIIRVTSGYTYRPMLMQSFFVYFVFGLYIGILFVRRWQFRFNLPLLICVFLPSLLLNPDIFLSLNIRIPYLPDIPSDAILGVLSGAFLLAGLFGTKSTKQRHPPDSREGVISSIVRFIKRKFVGRSRSDTL
jgi:hypothetical protein